MIKKDVDSKFDVIKKLGENQKVIAGERDKTTKDRKRIEPILEN